MEDMVRCSVVVSEAMLVGKQDLVFLKVVHGDVIDVCCYDFVDCVEECYGVIVCGKV